MISWAEKIREELINKANYLKQNQTMMPRKKKSRIRPLMRCLPSGSPKQTPNGGSITGKMTVRDISGRIAKISEEIRQK
ncbi:MAG: hypothetical protein R2874_03050 [Desulfobacterales bacterium]